MVKRTVRRGCVDHSRGLLRKEQRDILVLFLTIAKDRYLSPLRYGNWGRRLWSHGPKHSSFLASVSPSSEWTFIICYEDRTLSSGNRRYRCHGCSVFTTPRYPCYGHFMGVKNSLITSSDTANLVPKNSFPLQTQRTEQNLRLSVGAQKCSK
jgi:hypothetical protein